MEEKKMFLLSILTNKFVYKFLNKKEKKEIKVATPEISIHDFMRLQLDNVASVSRPIIELRRRLLIACGEYENMPENGEFENDVANVASQKTDIERFKEFLVEYSSKNGKLPAEKIIEKDLNLTRRQQQLLKTKLLEEGFLYKVNERTYKLNEVAS